VQRKAVFNLHRDHARLAVDIAYDALDAGGWIRIKNDGANDLDLAGFPQMK